MQRRKGLLLKPYINHLLEVASLVGEATSGADADLVVAALLHDEIEDQEVPRTLIADIFGEGVAKRGGSPVPNLRPKARYRQSK